MSIKSIVAKVFLGAAIVAALAGAAFYLWGENDSPTEDEENKNAVQVYKQEVSAEKVTIAIEAESAYVLSKTDGKWEMEGMEGIEVKSAYAEALLKSLSDISSPMIACENCAELSRYGMDKPKAQIKMTLDSDTVLMTVGGESGEYYYFATDNDSNVYIVLKQDLSMVFTEKMRYLDTYAVNVDANAIKRIKYADIELEKKGDYWFETKPYERLADDETVKTKILNVVSMVNADNIVDKSEALTLNGTTVEIDAGEEKIEFVVCKKDAQHSYVVKKDARYAYEVKNGAVDFLNVKAFEIIDKYVAPIHISEVEKIELTTPLGKHTIEAEEPESEGAVFYLDGRETDEESVRDFYAGLVSLTFKGEGKSTEKREYAIVFTHTNGTETKVEFLPYSQTDYAVSINGRTEFTIAKKSVSDVFAKLRSIKTI